MAIKLSEAHATLIYLMYASNKNALEYADALMSDPAFPGLLKHDCIRPIEIKLQWIKKALDLKVPAARRDLFDQQLKHNDTLRLDEIKRLFTKMTPEQQDLFERVGKAIVSKELIEFEDAK